MNWREAHCALKEYASANCSFLIKADFLGKAVKRLIHFHGESKLANRIV